MLMILTNYHIIIIQNKQQNIDIQYINKIKNPQKS